MNLPAASLDSHIRDIIETMRLFGRNKSNYPFAICHHNSKWWVTVELNTPKATVDFETSHADPVTALGEALARLRREARICGALSREAAAA